MEPLISVVISFYKGEQFIGETLQSVFNQNYSNLEVIVVDDGSPAESLSALLPFQEKIKIISQENKGQSEARNTGIRAARGTLIAILDQDDLWPKNHLAVMIPYLLPETEYDFVRGMVDHFKINSDGSRESSGPIFWEMLLGASLFRRSVFDRAGLFDASMREGEDLDWSLRLRESGCREKRIEDITLFYRRHNSNYSDVKDFIKNGQFQSIKKKLERMRLNKK